MLSGLSRTYRPKTEDGDHLPPESTRIQLRSHEVIQAVSSLLTELFDITATKDWGNCEARADVVVDGDVLVEKAPVTYLLFLEKQLSDLKTFVEKLPALDPSENWHLDEATDCWATEPVETTRTKKIPRNHVKAEATEHHPAQVEVYHEDIVVGFWKLIKFSGALPARQINTISKRVEALQKAVKYAREEANSHEVERKHVGKKVLRFLFKEFID